MKTTYEGWEICTACWDINPADWRPGDLPLYCASGYAHFFDLQAPPGKWRSQLRNVIPANKENAFEDPEIAHATITALLRNAIDGLRIY